MSEPFPTTPCDEWSGARDLNGYGLVKRRAVHSNNMKAHRVAWSDANGPIPKGMVVMHLCDNPPCVRLDHLRLGTQSENLKMAGARGRMARPPWKNVS